MCVCACRGTEFGSLPVLFPISDVTVPNRANNHHPFINPVSGPLFPGQNEVFLNTKQSLLNVRCCCFFRRSQCIKRGSYLYRAKISSFLLPRSKLLFPNILKVIPIPPIPFLQNNLHFQFAFNSYRFLTGQRKESISKECLAL